MAVNACKNSGNELFIKAILEESYEYWCPNCLNIDSVTKNESLEICKKYSNYSAYQNQLIDIDFDETDMSDY